MLDTKKFTALLNVLRKTIPNASTMEKINDNVDLPVKNLKDLFSLAEFCWDGCTTCDIYNKNWQFGSDQECPNETTITPRRHFNVTMDAILVAIILSIMMITTVITTIVLIRRKRMRTQGKRGLILRSGTSVESTVSTESGNRRPLPIPRDTPTYLDLCDVPESNNDGHRKKTGFPNATVSTRYTGSPSTRSSTDSRLKRKEQRKSTSPGPSVKHSDDYLSPIGDDDGNTFRRRPKSTSSAEEEEHDYEEVHTYYEI